MTGVDAVLIDETDASPEQLLIEALRRRASGLLVIAAVRPLGFTTDAAIADRHVLRVRSLTGRLIALAEGLRSSRPLATRAVIARASGDADRTLSRALRLARRMRAERLVFRDGDGSITSMATS